ncbi:MAG TPA: hypothetical protein DEB40_02740 [Elusimicrobia bacterium]|nr:hypothetical protein [Elusimicrobiota bacterium]HBT60647.1 hypothetical protein [Elusimicrobiota bacterium]
MLSWLYQARLAQRDNGDPFLELDAYESPEGRARLDRIDASFLTRLKGMGLAQGKVLVLGAGAGRLVLKLAREFPGCETTGIDRCAAALEEGIEKARPLGLVGKVWLVEGDACRLDFPDSSFDAVLCDNLLHHIPDPVRMLNEAGRVARPEARVLIRDLSRPLRPAWAWLRPRRDPEYPEPLRASYLQSLQAAYTLAELRELSSRSRLAQARISLDEDHRLILALP